LLDIAIGLIVETIVFATFERLTGRHWDMKR
jgi:hypothetical protein